MASTISLQLIADAHPLLKTLDNAQRNLDRFIASADAAGKSLGSGFSRALDTFTDVAKGGAAAAGGLAGGFAAAAASAVLLTASAGRQVEELDQLSQKTGIALNTLQSWAVIMGENNFQAESLAGGMRTLSKLMVDAQNSSSDAASTFEQLGISIGALGSVESVMRAVADKFKDMPDGAEKSRIAVTLFGKSGLELIPILNRGSAAFDESRQAAERFAAVLHTQQVAALKAADDALDRVGVAAGALKVQLGSLFAPTVEGGARVFAEVLGGVARVVRDVDTAMDTLAIRFSHFALAVNELGAILFSKDAFSSAAWMQAVDNLKMIDQEATKLIAKRRELAASSAAGVEQNAHVLEQMEHEVELGTAIVALGIHNWKMQEAAGRAEQALGNVTIAILQREQTERNNLFALQLEQAEQVNNLQFETRNTTALDRQIAAVKQLTELFPELNAQEAALLAIHNQEAAHDTITKSVEAYEQRNAALDTAVAKAKALDEHQQALFATESGLIGASEAALRVRMSLIDAEAERRRVAIDEEIHNEERKAQALRDLDEMTEARRRQAVQQFPGFYEQQLQAIVNSNTFSMGQMVSTWSNGIANMVVHGGNLVAVWEQTQVMLVQAALTSGVQMLANLALNTAKELAIEAAKEQAKTALQVAGAAERLALTQAEAAAEVGIMAGAQAMVVGMFGTVTAAFSAMFAGLVTVVTAVGTFIMGVLSAIAAALTATVFGIPWAGAILLGIAAIAAALALSGNLGFKEGGIGDFGAGTPATLHGQEAIIPLNGRGAAFLQEAFGGMGMGGSLTVPVYLDRREIARVVVDSLPDALRNAGVPVFGR